MVERNIQTELLLELVLSNDSEIEEDKILSKSIPLYLRKLNCFIAGVLKYTNDDPSEVVVMPYVAKQSAEWTKAKNFFKHKIPLDSEPCIQTAFNEVYYYCFSLENYGQLILGRKKEFEKSFTNDLRPVINHLGKLLIRAREIEQRKKAEQSLVESEQRLRTLSYTIQTGVFIYNDFNIIYTNPAAEYYTGYLNEELMRMQFIDLIHDDFKELLDQIDTKHHYNNTKLEIKITCKDNTSKWLEITKDIIQWKGEFANIISAFDITRRKKTEESLRESEQRLNLSLVVNKASVFEINFESNKLLTTPDLYYSLGYVQNEIPGNLEEMMAFLHPGDVKPVMATIDRYFKGESSEYYDEFRMKNKDGQYKWVNGKGRIVQRNAKGEPTVLLGISQDISKQKQIEHEVIKAKDKAEESDRLKSAFLANMSHEIRTPLNSIIGFAQILSDTDVDKIERIEYNRLIEQSSVRMLTIINDLIDISKIESGQMELDIGEVNVNEHIDYIYRMFKPEVEINGISFESNMPLINDDAIITSDGEKLYAILTNLVKNAIKFTDEGFIKFGYNYKNDEIEFYVKDSGSGIPSDQLKTIFNRFRMGSQPLNKKYRGSGLGLSISKAYVEMLGGKIWVESEIDSGTSFYFTIPLKLQPN